MGGVSVRTGVVPESNFWISSLRMFLKTFLTDYDDNVAMVLRKAVLQIQQEELQAKQKGWVGKIQEPNQGLSLS